MPPRATNGLAGPAAPVRLGHVPHSAGWPAAWRFRLALRALALDILDRRTGAITPAIDAAAMRVIDAWQGTDSVALRAAERRLAAALIAHLTKIDSGGWMACGVLMRRFRSGSDSA